MKRHGKRCAAGCRFGSGIRSRAYFEVDRLRELRLIELLWWCFCWLPASDGASYAAKFSGRRTHRVIKGVGHNLPQEAPGAFADAVMAVDRY